MERSASKKAFWKCIATCWRCSCTFGSQSYLVNQLQLHEILGEVDRVCGEKTHVLDVC